MNRIGWTTALFALSGWLMGCPNETPKVECSSPSDCTAPTSPCAKATCEANKCGTSNVAADTAIAKQTAGDCIKVVCDGKGKTRSVIDDDDVPDDGDPCTDDRCDQGSIYNDPSPAGTECGSGQVCDGAGSCVADTCGNGKLDGAEACDATDLGGKTCVTLGQGFSGGTLACKADCTLDTAGCSTSLCGNGYIDGMEECDGTNLNGKDCAAQGFAGGTLSCKSDCTLDLTACTAGADCGNGAINGSEQCDGANLNGKTCATAGNFSGGTLSCNANCTFNTNLCAANLCGNGNIDGTEKCDGANLNAKTCLTEGFSGGSIACKSDCTLDLTGCTAPVTCGNGALDANEQCDGANLNSKTCATEGFAGGALACNANCTLNTTACLTTLCGNGQIDGAEQCDGSNFNNKTCATEGFAGGTLACKSDCTLDKSNCTSTATCGNGTIDSGEDCEGKNLDGKTCLTQGFAGGGSLKCDPSTCKFDTSSCASNACGNGSLDSGEDCDGANLNGKTCATAGNFTGGTLACNATTCKFDTSGCTAPACGNGQLDSGEDCDGANLNGKACTDQGFTGGTLKCAAATCKFDTSACTGTPTCGVAASLGTVATLGGVARGGKTSAGKSWVEGQFVFSQDYDGVLLELREGGGFFASGLAGGTYTLAGAELAYDTCSLCVVMVDSANKTYMPTAGSVTLTSVSGKLTGTLSNLAFAEVKIDGQTGATSKVAGGCASTMASMAFDADIVLPPASWVCADAYYNDGQDCDCGCGALDADCVDATADSCDYCDDAGSCATDCSEIAPTDNSKCTATNPCGNGKIDSGEDCDGTLLNAKTCVTQGFTGGTLACKADCTFDTSACTGSNPCGNGAIDGTEQCDGTNLNGKTCATAGGSFTGGTLACKADCTFDTSACTGAATCGNGAVEGTEACDGTNLNGSTCLSLGFTGGTLACAASTCKFNLDGCTGAPSAWTCNTMYYGDGGCDCGCGARDVDCKDGLVGSCQYCRDTGSCNTAACPGTIDPVDNSKCVNPCGNGTLDSGEDCDGANLNSKTCVTQGYTGGTLKCSATTCKFDTSSCTGTNPCGNGTLDSGEQCDGTNLNGKTCATVGGGFTGGTLACSATCTFVTTACNNDPPAEWTCDPTYFAANDGCDCGCGAVDPDCADATSASCDYCSTKSCAPSSCSTIDPVDNSKCTTLCGNTRIDASAGEDCDGTNLNSKTCLTQGFGGGTLKCAATTCKFDTSSCTPLAGCGNGAIDAGEDCDGTNLNSKTCLTQGFGGGTLACDAACKFVTSACTPIVTCGNGNIDSGEDCDGTNLNSKTCATQGFAGGTLTCGSNCKFVTTACTMCGNNTIDGSEPCDGTNLNSKTCVTQGFAGGTLTCNNCAFVTTFCTMCGNNAIDGSEQCDGTNLNSKTCATEGFASGTLACGSDCKVVTTACSMCGNNVLDGAEPCDGTNFGTRTCVTEGFAAGSLACTASCGLNTSGCTMCGNNVINGSEQCDGTNLNGKTCATVGGGFTGGTLACGAGCTYVTTGCTTGAVCGNNTIEAGEVCDGTTLGGHTCVTEGYTSGTLACAACKPDTASCVTKKCGVPQSQYTQTVAASYARSGGTAPDRWEIGYFDLNTETDSIQLELYEGFTVFSGGINAGTFTLSANEQSYATCGLCVRLFDDLGKVYMPSGTSGSVTLTSVNGRLTGTLNDVSFREVTIAADLTTTPVTGGCSSNIASMAFDAQIHACGDGILSGAEVCDGTLQSVATTCQDFGYSGGTLTCNSTCGGYLATSCTVGTGESGSAQCLDGADNNANGAQDCEDAACWTDATTNNVCNSDVTFDGTCTEKCDRADNCGLGLPDELACGCTNDAGCDGIVSDYRCYTELTASWGMAVCASPCQQWGSTGASRDTFCTNLLGATSFCDASSGGCKSGSGSCGDGFVSGTEVCDGSNLAGQSCTTVPGGFTGGTLACSACAFNTSGCTTAAACTPSQVVVSQVYGGGGSSSSTAFLYDFVELHNRSTTATATLTNWTVQYASSTGTSWSTVATLNTTIAPGKYLLVRTGTAGTGGSTYTLPTPDATGTVSMNATVGKVALVSNTTALSGVNPTGTQIIDLVGYGTGTNGFETAPTATLSSTNSAQRGGSGCTDTNNNSADFTVAAATVARNSATAALTCGCQ